MSVVSRQITLRCIRTERASEYGWTKKVKEAFSGIIRDSYVQFVNNTGRKFVKLTFVIHHSRWFAREVVFQWNRRTRINHTNRYIAICITNRVKGLHWRTTNHRIIINYYKSRIAHDLATDMPTKRWFYRCEISDISRSFGPAPFFIIGIGLSRWRHASNAATTSGAMCRWTIISRRRPTATRSGGREREGE